MFLYNVVRYPGRFVCPVSFPVKRVCLPSLRRLCCTVSRCERKGHHISPSSMPTASSARQSFTAVSPAHLDFRVIRKTPPLKPHDNTHARIEPNQHILSIPLQPPDPHSHVLPLHLTRRRIRHARLTIRWALAILRRRVDQRGRRRAVHLGLAERGRSGRGRVVRGRRGCCGSRGLRGRGRPSCVDAAR